MSNHPALWLVLIFVATCGCAGPGAARPPVACNDTSRQGDDGDVTVVELEGMAVLLGDAVHARTKLELADAAMDDVVAFATNNGRLIAILPTESALFFYRDAAVRNRPMRVTARVWPGLDALEIIDRVALVDGKPHEIYYWCEICSIRMYHKKDCECCQGPTELREHPVGEPFRVGAK